jgi:putative nucleotidyltransferase with HDIG domain/PAS domain S-box-containing protein
MSTNIPQPRILERFRCISTANYPSFSRTGRFPLKFKVMVESLPDGLVVVKDGFLKYANPRALALMGYGPEELLETPFLIHVGSENGNPACLGFLAGGEIPGARLSLPPVWLRRKDGKRVRVELNIACGRFGKERAYLISIREAGVDQQTREQLETAMTKLRQAMNATISAMSMTIETRDPYTSSHQKRVAELAEAIAAKMGLSPEEVECVKMAATIHDLGKIAIPAEILSKPGRISEVEFRLIQKHPQVAYDILRTIDFPWPVADAVLQHHERLNGTGYPNGLKGDQIMTAARILAVADVVEAMVSHRPYRSALTLGEAIYEITKNRDVLYDKEVVDACRKLFIEGDFRFSN